MTHSDGSPAILIVQHSSMRDGSAFSGLLLADGLLGSGWETHVAFGHEGPMETVYSERGHNVHVVGHDNWLRRERFHRFARDVAVEMRTSNSFISLIDTLKPQGGYVNTVVSLSASLAFRRRGVPFVWHLRELFADGGGEMRVPRSVRPLVPGVVLGLADRAVTSSRITAKNVLGARSKEASIVPNAVDDSFLRMTLSKTEARRKLALPATGRLIGVPGTLRAIKGHAFLFRSVAPLLFQRPGLRVIVAGSGERRFVDSLKRQVAGLGIAERVDFLGTVSDMRAFYRASDVVCVPSRSESFGRTVIEAFAVGTPVVATAVGGMLEIVEHGRTGLLVPFGDEEGLAEALATVLDVDPSGDSGLAARMVEEARRVASTRFHNDICTARIIEIIEETVR